MMQQRLLPILTLFALIFVIPTQAQNWNWGKGEKGNKKVVEQNRDLDGFTKVGVSSGIDLYLTQGSSFQVQIITDENIQDNIVTQVNGNRLTLKVEGSISPSKLEARVTLPSLEGITASGGSDVFGQNEFRIDDLELSMSGGSDLELSVRGKTLHMNLSGGSDAKLVGQVGNIEANTSGGSDLRANKLIAERIEISCSGGSDAWIHATQSVDIRAAGASDVRYSGDPAKVQAKASSASDITKG